MKENVHTVKILDIIVSDDMTDFFLVMNYVEQDLSSVLSQTETDLDEEHTVLLLFKMLCGLYFLH